MPLFLGFILILVAISTCTSVQVVERKLDGVVRNQIELENSVQRLDRSIDALDRTIGKLQQINDKMAAKP